MQKALGLHQMSALDLNPFELAESAFLAGCQEVSVFVRSGGLTGEFPLVTRANRDAFIQDLLEHNLRVANIESFMLLPNTDAADFRDDICLGAELGARGMTAILCDPDQAHCLANLQLMCDMAAESGLSVWIEFMPLMPIWKTLDEVMSLIDKTGRDNIGVGLDLLHLARAGVTPAQVATLPASRIGYVQLCDSNNTAISSDYADEATYDRLPPGQGQLPVVDYLRALPKAIPLELEVPQRSSLTSDARLAQAADTAREQMQLAGLG